MTTIADNITSNLEAGAVIRTFESIVTFVSALEDEFGKYQKSLKLYRRLIEKTTVVHKKAIAQHISAFRDFCAKNKKALEEQDPSLFNDPIVRYSPNVFINMKLVFSKADEDTANVVWKHLLTISVLLDPSNDTKSLLKNFIETTKSSSPSYVSESGNSTKSLPTNDFLTNMVRNISGTIGAQKGVGPEDALSDILNNDMFTDLLGSLNSTVDDSGKLDLKKLLGTVKNMANELVEKCDETGIPPQLGHVLKDVTSSLGNINPDTIISEDIDGKLSEASKDVLTNFATNMSTLTKGLNDEDVE